MKYKITFEPIHEIPEEVIECDYYDLSDSFFSFHDTGDAVISCISAISVLRIDKDE